MFTLPICEATLADRFITEPLARQARDQLLTETDWCASTDVIMSDDMTTYRQALRDITDQAGFPTNITWPQEPSA